MVKKGTAKATEKRLCLSCGESIRGNGIRAREHVIPSWLLQEWNISKEVLSNFWAEPNKTTLVRKQVMNSFVEGRFCAKCNNGWMSRLETAAMQLILDLADARINPVNLDEGQRKIVARWAAKTVVVLSHATAMAQPIDPKYFREFRDNSHDGPHGAVVFLTHITLNNASKIMWAKTDGTSPLFLGNANYSTVPKVGLLLGSLLILVAFPLPMPYSIRIAAGVYVPIWPNAEFMTRFVHFDREVKKSVLIKNYLDSIEIMVEIQTGVMEKN